MTKDLKLDHGGIASLLKSGEMRALVSAAAEKVAANVSGQGITVGAFKGGAGDIPLPVKVSVTTTDRAHANVVLAHPAGIATQAKHGALTKAASAAGLEVKGD